MILNLSGPIFAVTHRPPRVAQAHRSAMSCFAGCNKGAGPKGKTPPIVLVVNLEIQPDAVEQFMEAINIDLQGSRKEKGCLRFDLLKDEKARNKFTLYEAYKDAAALAFHKASKHFQAWSEFKATGNVTSMTVTKQVGVNFR